MATENLGFDDAVGDSLVRLYQSDGMRRRQGLALDAAKIEPRDTVVDLGCGPGFYLVPLVERAGPNGIVIGVDPSPDMLSRAGQRASTANLREGSASAIPVDDSSVDSLLSVQVFEYIYEIPQALREVGRVLRPGGRVTIWDSDWSSVSWHTGDPDRMAAVLSAWDDHLAQPVLPQTLAATMRSIGFGEVTTTGHAFTMTSLAPGTMAEGLVGLIHDFVAIHPDIGEETAGAWRDELRDLDSTGEFFFAYLQFAFCGTAPEGE